MAPLSVVLAKVKIGLCEDPRPCVVLAIDGNGCPLVLPISSQMDKYRSDLDFLLDDAHPDFKQTGLSRRSYVIDIEAQRVPLDRVRKKPYGQIENQLAAEFTFWLTKAGYR